MSRGEHRPLLLALAASRTVAACRAVPSTVPGPCAEPRPARDSSASISAAVAEGTIAGVVRSPWATPSYVDIVELGVRDTTAAGGRFRFDGVAAGRYTLRALTLGFAPFADTVDLAPRTGVFVVLRPRERAATPCTGER